MSLKIKALKKSLWVYIISTSFLFSGVVSAMDIETLFVKRSKGNINLDKKIVKPDRNIVKRIIKRMRKYFKEGNWEGICECAYILEKHYKGFAVDALTSSFKNKQYHPVFRKMLSDIMDDIKDRKATKGLIEVLDDISDIPFVRAQAADTLGDIGGEGVFEALVRNLNDPDDSVRGSCARALGYLGDRRAGDYLIPLVEDESEFVRDNAIGALVLLKDERAFDILLKEMEKVKGDELKLRSVINCLGRLGDKRAIPYLIEFTKEKYPKFVRTSAIRSLSMFGKENKRVVEILIKLLKDGDGYIVLWTGRELAEMGCKEAIKPIEEAIKRVSSEEVREDLKKSYKKLTGKEYIE